MTSFADQMKSLPDAMESFVEGMMSIRQRTKSFDKAMRSRNTALWLDNRRRVRQILGVRACGVRTYESRQGRKAATAVSFAIAAVTLAFFYSSFTIGDLRFTIYDWPK